MGGAGLSVSISESVGTRMVMAAAWPVSPRAGRQGGEGRDGALQGGIASGDDAGGKGHWAASSAEDRMSACCPADKRTGVRGGDTGPRRGPVASTVGVALRASEQGGCWRRRTGRWRRLWV